MQAPKFNTNKANLAMCEKKYIRTKKRSSQEYKDGLTLENLVLICSATINNKGNSTVILKVSEKC